MSKKTTPPPVPSLKLLAGNKDYEGVARVEIFGVDPDLVTFEKGFNLRPDVAFTDGKDPLKAHLARMEEATTAGTEYHPVDAHIQRLFLAMKNGASVPPIDVRVDNGKIIGVDGHCRTIAARRMKKEFPDFMLQARQFRGNEQDRVLHMLGTGSGQMALSPLEQGIGYLRLIKYGMTAPQIAEKLGVSRVTVDNGLTLAEAPVEVQNMVREGVVSSTTAREAVKQGVEGVEALKKAAAEQKDSPATTKGGKASKKKKVTTAKLKGTAAVKPKVKKKAVTEAVDTSSTHAGVLLAEQTGKRAFTLADIAPNTDTITVTLEKSVAASVVSFLRANAPDSAKEIKDFATALEMQMM